MGQYGRYIDTLTAADDIGAIVGYFHKLVAPARARPTGSSFLDGARIHKIPVVVICPANVMERAKEILGTNGETLQWVTPDQVCDKVMSLIG